MKEEIKTPVDDIVIHVWVDSEGCLQFDIFADQQFDELYDVSTDDGGICTSGQDEDGPHKPVDWENAIGMAAEQVKDIVAKRLK